MRRGKATEWKYKMYLSISMNVLQRTAEEIKRKNNGTCAKHVEKERNVKLRVE